MPLDAYIGTAILCGIALLVAMIRWPKVWIASFLLYLPFFLTDTGVGLTTREVVIGAFFSGSVVLWMIWSIGRSDRRLIRHWADFLLLLYVILTAGNVVIALLNDVDILLWSADYAVVCIMLYYFPIREFFATERDVKQLMIIAGVAAIGMAVMTVYLYRQRMMSGGLIYAFQLVASRSVTLAAVHLLAVLFGSVAMFYARWKTQIFIAIVIATNAAALFLSFGRTLWVFFFVCLGITMFFLTLRQSTKLVLTMIVAGAVSVAAAFVINPRLAEVGTRVVTSRFTSSTQLSGGDLSFETRIIEAGYAWRHIKRYPLGGKGLRDPFISYHPIDGNHHNTSFVHIGYLGLAMRQGIPMLILMLAILLLFTIMSWKGAVKLRPDGSDRLYRMMAVVMFANMPALFANIFMAGIFDQRYGNVMFAFIFACIGIAYEIAQQRSHNPATLVPGTA